MKSKPEKISGDAQVLLVQTFANSFNSMPKWIRWGTIIAVILGLFYFTVVQKVWTEVQDQHNITHIQKNISGLIEKIDMLEKDHEMTWYIADDIEDLLEFVSAFEEVQRYRHRILVKCLKHMKTPQNAKYIEEYEAAEASNEDTYQTKLSDIYSKKIKRQRERYKNIAIKNLSDD